jgi:hypothetical protein
VLRFVFLVLIALGLVAVVTRSPLARRTLWVLLGLMVLYAILKLTGVIEAIAPSRTGVF